MAYYLPSPYNSYSSEIQTIQRQLNALRTSHSECRYKWDSLEDDGYYGKLTAGVVTKFQSVFHLTSPQAGALGDTTIRKIRELYDQLPSWRSASGPILSAAPAAVSPSGTFSLNHEGLSLAKDIAGNILSFVKEIADTGIDLITLKSTPLDVVKRFWRFDKDMQKIINRIQVYTAKRHVDSDTEKLAKTRNRPGRDSFAKQQAIKKAQNEVRDAKFYERLAEKTYNTLHQHSQSKVDKLTGDIVTRLKKVGLSKRVVDKIKKSFNKENLRAVSRKAGIAGWVLTLSDVVISIIGFVIYHNDILNDPLLYEEWLKNFIDQLCAIVDGMIDFFIAELVVVAGVALLAAAGVAGSGGIIAGVVIGLITLLVAIIIGFIRGDKSYTKFITEKLSSLMIDKVMTDFGKLQIERINRGQLEVGKI